MQSEHWAGAQSGVEMDVNNTSGSIKLTLQITHPHQAYESVEAFFTLEDFRSMLKALLRFDESLSIDWSKVCRYCGEGPGEELGELFPVGDGSRMKHAGCR